MPRESPRSEKEEAIDGHFYDSISYKIKKKLIIMNLTNPNNGYSVRNGIKEK